MFLQHGLRVAGLSALIAAALVTISTRTDVIYADGLRYIRQAQRLDRGDWRDGAGRRADAARLRAERFDVAVLLPNSFHAAWLARRAGIPERWGYARDLRGWLLTRAIPRRRGVTQAAYYLDLVTALGAPSMPLTAALSIPEGLGRAAETTLRQSGWRGEPMVAFAPGAAFGPAKKWPPSRVGLVAAQMRAAEAVTAPDSALICASPGLARAGADRVAAAKRRAMGALANVMILLLNSHTGGATTGLRLC